jgi:NAD(P)-dependent dehydrogenase (short-subunit alcohol dehydrogenase family)
VNLQGKVCVVTGAASGIGQQMAIELAKQGAHVVAVARDDARAQEAARAIGNGAEGVACDIASIASIKRAAGEINKRHPKIHLLVNNAAVFNKERRTTGDGLELGYAVNTLAPFLFSTLLLDALKAGAPSRIVNMTMPTKNPLSFDDLQAEKSFKALPRFEATKGGHQYLTKELARRVAGTNVSVVCVTPGLTQSKLPSEAPLPLRLVFKLFGKTPSKGALVPLSVCLDDKFKSGIFVDDKGHETAYPAFIDDAAAAKLYEINTQIAGR